jgi:dTDP-4-amino-4,6-dideoxygalactose transaminase
MSENQLIRLSRSIVGGREAEAVGRVITDDGYLGMGAEVQAFEKDLADYLGVPSDWVISVNSGTAALHLAVASAAGPGDDVLVQSLTFVASFQAISAVGARPVACEVLSDSATLDLRDAASRITPKSRVVMPVHYASYPGDLDAVYDFAKENNLRVIEDAAHALGCTYKGRKIGSFGDIVCFSFDGIKNITSGEGGAVVTSDPETARFVRDARLLGVQRDTEKRFQGERSWEFEVAHQGFRYHMSNIMAAIGRVQLDRLESEFAPARRSLAAQYRKRLAEACNLIFLQSDAEAVIPHIMPVRILKDLRNGLRQHLESRKIQTGIHYKPNHLLTYYGGGGERLPVSESLYGELLSLPLHPGLDSETIDGICDLIIEYLKDAPESQ